MKLYEMLKAAKMGAGAAPDMYTALMARTLPFSKGVHQLSGIPPLTFTANGQPLIDWTIYGNMSQSGTPSPSSPIYPSECGDKTANLFDKSNTDLIFPGTTLANVNQWSGGGGTGKVIRIPCEPSTTYTISGASSSSIFRISLSERETPPAPDGSAVCIDVLKATSVSTQTFTTTANTKYILVQVGASAFDDYINVLMLNTGSTALPYEPYGYKIPILNNSQTTNVYLGEVETTRKIRKYEFTGEEGWVVRAGTPESVFFYERQDINFINNTAICSHYPNQDSGNYTYFQDKHFLVRISLSKDRTYLGIRDSSYPSSKEGAEQFKTYLRQQYAAGTPVTIWCVLATEETAVVNEPLMKIGDYADSVSMEQTGIEIPTTNGQNTLTVGTSVQPSRVEIKYCK